MIDIRAGSEESEQRRRAGTETSGKEGGEGTESGRKGDSPQ